jgi:glucan phosphoethanolaminetransferase (alkaline phosphatase superfamily)
MKTIQLSKRILASELMGFLIVIMIVWLDEFIDLPHELLGAPATPINYIESIFETIIISVLAVLVILLTHTLLKRILSGILPVCSFCKKIRVDDRWIPIDSYIRDHSEVDFSHGICPQCAAENYGDLLDLTRSKKRNDV